MVEFAKLTDEETQILFKISDRAINADIYEDPMDAEMDICAVHAHTPLRLADLLAADDFNFTHDMAGILRHINRETGELENFFLPRFARPEVE